MILKIGPSRGGAAADVLSWFWLARGVIVASGGGNVGISRCLRDFQGTVGRAEKLLLLFRSSHGPGISTDLFPGRDLQPREGAVNFELYGRCGDVRRRLYPRAGRGASLLHRRSICVLAAAIFRAHSVSLICRAV